MKLYMVNLPTDTSGDNRDYLVVANDPRQAYDLWWQRQLEDEVFDPEDAEDRFDNVPDRIFEITVPTNPGVVAWFEKDGAKVVWDRESDSTELLGVSDPRTPKPTP